MARHVVASALVLSAVFIAAGCGKTSEKVTESAATVEVAASETAPVTTAAAPATTATSAATPAAAATAAGTVIASETYSQDANLRADLLEVRRVSGGALLVKWRVVNATPVPAGGLASAEAKPIYYDFSWDNLYYVDPAENKKYGYLTDSEGNRILDVWWGSLKTGEQRANWAKFPAPPATSTKISLALPKFPPFEDVPVAP